MCAAKDVVKGKGKRGWKYKSVLLDEGKPELDLEPNLELELELESKPELETRLSLRTKARNGVCCEKSQKEYRETCSKVYEYCKHTLARTNATARVSVIISIDCYISRDIEYTSCADVLKCSCRRQLVGVRGVRSYCFFIQFELDFLRQDRVHASLLCNRIKVSPSAFIAQ